MTTIRRVRVFRINLGYGWAYEVRRGDDWHQAECEGHWNRETAVHHARLQAMAHECPLVGDGAELRPEDAADLPDRLVAQRRKRHHGAHALAGRLVR